MMWTLAVGAVAVVVAAGVLIPGVVGIVVLVAVEVVLPPEPQAAASGRNANDNTAASNPAIVLIITPRSKGYRS